MCLKTKTKKEDCDDNDKPVKIQAEFLIFKTLRVNRKGLEQMLTRWQCDGEQNSTVVLVNIAQRAINCILKFNCMLVKYSTVGKIYQEKKLRSHKEFISLIPEVYKKL